MGQKQKHAYDVVIAGGGMVGASLAVALAGLDLKLALVEAVPLENSGQPSFDDRTIALSRGSRQILDSLALWNGIGERSWPIHKIHVSEQGRFGTAVIDGTEQGIGELGALVPARVLGEILWARIEELDAIDVFCPGRLVEVQASADHVTATLASAEGDASITAKLVTVADGARSGLRGQLGIGADSKAYGQTAIVGNVGIDARRSGHVAYERFTLHGPMALLPGHDNTCTFVLTRAEELAPTVMALDDAAFLQLLQQTFGYRLGRFGRLGTRHAYPLHLVTAERVTANRAVIVGNAAHGLHPVAGQGFNLGLRDVATLAEILADTLQDPETSADVGNPQLLELYSDWRYRDQRNVVAFTDGLIRLFDIPSDAAAVARGFGLLAFDLLPGAKRALAHHTMGLSGTLTRLARGLPL